MTPERDTDEIIRRHRRPEQAPKPHRGVRWSTFAELRKDHPAWHRPPIILASVERVIGADRR